MIILYCILYAHYVLHYRISLIRLYNIIYNMLTSEPIFHKRIVEQNSLKINRIFFAKNLIFTVHNKSIEIQKIQNDKANTYMHQLIKKILLLKF